MSLSMVTRSDEAGIVLDIAGRVTLEDAPEFLETLVFLLKKEKPRRVVVNMTDVSYIDSAGIACLVEALKLARDSKIAFALFGLGPVARDVLELTKLISVFEVYDTEEEALRGNPSSAFGPAD
jgi:anti-sigma B factor antagonist